MLDSCVDSLPNASTHVSSEKTNVFIEAPIPSMPPSMLGDWLEAPAELLPAPEALLGFGLRCAKRPLSLISPEPAGIPSHYSAAGRNASRRARDPPNKKNKRMPKPPSIFLPKWLDSCSEHPRRVGRCRFSMPDGACAAVPYTLASMDKHRTEDTSEVIVIEMRGPCAEEAGWLDDETVHWVICDVGSPLQIRREKVRSLVHAKVPLTPCARTLSTGVYVLCAPLSGSHLLVTLVPKADLIGLEEKP